MMLSLAPARRCAESRGQLQPPGQRHGARSVRLRPGMPPRVSRVGAAHRAHGRRGVGRPADVEPVAEPARAGPRRADAFAPQVRGRARRPAAGQPPVRGPRGLKQPLQRLQRRCARAEHALGRCPGGAQAPSGASAHAEQCRTAARAPRAHGRARGQPPGVQPHACTSHCRTSDAATMHACGPWPGRWVPAAERVLLALPCTACS